MFTEMVEEDGEQKWQLKGNLSPNL